MTYREMYGIDMGINLSNFKCTLCKKGNHCLLYRNFGPGSCPSFEQNIREDIDYTIVYHKCREEKMEKEFTKDMLESRMVVEYRNGERRIVVNNILMGEYGWGKISEYNNDLTNNWDKNLDIIKVFDKIDTFDILSEKSRLDKMLLWERKEIKEVTLKEIAEKFGVDEVKVIEA